MTITVANTSNTSTFEYWLNRTNELASAMTNYAVTTNSNTAAGNAAITGTFTATSVSLSNSTSNISITIPTSSQISNGVFYLNANGSWSAAGGLLSQAVSTTGTSIQNIDSFSTSTYRTAEYLISVKDNVANNYYSSKLIVMHDGGNSYITEYGIMTSNSSVGTFSANIISSNVCLQFTPISSNTTVKFAKVIL